MAKLDLGGIYPPIATPFNSDETIAYDKLQANMDIWNRIPFRGKTRLLEAKIVLSLNW